MITLAGTHISPSTAKHHYNSVSVDTGSISVAVSSAYSVLSTPSPIAKKNNIPDSDTYLSGGYAGHGDRNNGDDNDGDDEDPDEF